MSHDLSRKIFNPLDDYFGVVMQQGRVQLDADWNELVSQFKRRMQAESLDTFGPGVVPRETANGFLISGPVSAFEIGPGRIYVDGLLAENHTDTLKWDARLAEISGTAKLSGADVDAAPTGPAGTTAYDQQPYYPNPPDLPGGETYLVYIDVWQRDITWLQDADLVDVAVGVDTTAREQTVWQVKFLDNVGDLDVTVADVDIPGWLQTIHPSSARLSTATGDLVGDDNPCLLPPQAGYKGLENQLYRVQVHDGGPLGSATFKWSRDNAIVSSRVSAIPGGNEIVVDSLGRDDVLGFHEGDWVEITDDHRDLMGMPGELRRIQLGDGIDSATRSITLEGSPLPVGSGEGEFPVDGDDQTDPARNTRIIRWDQAGIVFREDETEYTDLDEPASSGAIEIPATGTRLFLEKGILVDFDLESVVDEADFDPEFKVGDYWIFSARVNDASIELLDRAPPLGIHHHYAKLAIVTSSGITDCRTLWPPEAGGQGCACTVCVYPDDHNNGSATIQQAIDKVNAAGGGAVCLGVGEYYIDKPVRITGTSVTLRGSGWQTMLIRRNPGVLIEIGSEEVAYDITVQRLLGLTSIARGFESAVTVNNVAGLNLSECLIANLASEGGTSQAIQFNGLAMLVAVDSCELLAERGIVGPRLQDDYLGTVDFSIRDCIMACSTQGISFTGSSFHLGRLDIRDNQISECRDVGIELSGSVSADSAVDIDGNLLIRCNNGIRGGVSRLRIRGNDLETVRNEKEPGNAISLVAGLEPGVYDDIQIIGNRVRNYNGHAIGVRTGIGRIIVKQNQVHNISGGVFVIEPGGSVEYLSLENNQFTDIDGVMTHTKETFAGVLLEAVVRADIVNNLFDGVVRIDRAVDTRAGISVAGSRDVRINGNRLLAVTAPAYTGLGVGILINSDVGAFEVSDNEVRRVPEDEDRADEKLADAAWMPLLVQGSRETFLQPDRSGRKAATAASEVFISQAMKQASVNRMASVPVVTVDDRIYAVTMTDMVSLGLAAITDNDSRVQANRLDATTGTGNAVYIMVSRFCGFIDNEVRSTNESELVLISADHVTINNNRLMNRIQKGTTLRLQSRVFVVIGNMLTGEFLLIDPGGNAGSLPSPWKELNHEHLDLGL